MPRRRARQISIPETPDERTPSAKKRSLPRRILWGLVWLSLTGLIFGALGAVGLYLHITEDLPLIHSLNDYRPPVVTTVHAADGTKIAEFYTERRIVVPLSEMPENLIRAFVAAEDARFFEHEGVDFLSILRAAVKNIEAGEVIQGGSTITQQVARSFFLTPERSYRRKLREAILAYRIDRALTKDEILFLYLNQIYLGYGAYGVGAAAENYFGRSAGDLTLAQCATLAGLPPAPARYSPVADPERSRRRRRYVLERMVIDGYISPDAAEAAAQVRLEIQPRRNWFMESAPWYAEHVRRIVEARVGHDALYRGGLTIHTAVDLNLQRAARAAVDRGVRALDKRQGYRGPVDRIAPDEIPDYLKALEAGREALGPEAIRKGVVVETAGPTADLAVDLGGVRGRLSPEGRRWARTRLKVGDVIQVKLGERPADGDSWPLSLDQTPVVEGALLCVETGTGYVRAMVGGRDYSHSQFNRAVQSRRQPGSAFKPIIYTAALENGYTPATILSDTPFVYRVPDGGGIWRPDNYDRRFLGPLRLRQALAKSRNIPAVRVLADIGEDAAVDAARRLGIVSRLHRSLSMALGASGVSLQEMVGAFSVFADGGRRIEPVFVTRIIDRDGRDISPLRVEPEAAVDPGTAYLMTSLLQSVVESGTGRRVRALGRPVAGKTGTTNDFRDAWFLGFTPDYVAGAWVGFDQERSLGRRETGSKAASPIWLDFMTVAHEGLPVREFPVPDEVVFAEIDRTTGLLARSGATDTFRECFRVGTEPTASAPTAAERAARRGLVADPVTFFKSGM